MATNPLSQEQDSRAREFEALFLTRLASVGQKNVATSVDLSESAISNWKKEGLIERFCKALVVMELQVVPSEAQCHPAKYIDALRTLAELGLQAEHKRPGPLGWD
ncbi:transcriptional regulator [Pseudomonas proteolytica]|uniref:Transcriptional regulator n=1 Tax=Pseudomonas proteolytica TaxID=219574 RepID=A0AAW5A0I2_9PSED|nr:MULTISPECIES: CII family transcriptional regulator [Pseudomonas fluorescens group]AYG06852.1 transcriptional regulator [Pseudomonas fluorescens]KWV82531.1 hypothetical protein PFLL34_03580 [Pseudomonas fluorescens]MCF5056045.1 transcriptional regulator [Pseudomonas proteolytica]MCF5100507.1 transcriptional regulator [Pseudomonas proteolytica]